MDALLATCLVGLVPAYMLWRSRSRGSTPPKGPLVSLWRTLGLAAGLTALLAASWLRNGRRLSDLGLVYPLSPAAEIGLGIAVVVLSGFAIAIVLQLRSKKTKAEDMAKALEHLPRTKGEAARFIPLIVLISAAWELLYRGFLLWFLTPRIGLAGAIAMAATVYALAHGYKGVRSFAASLVSALLFTVGYAVTRSLWWLILLHAGLPVLVSLASLCRRASGPPPVGVTDAALPTA